MKTRICSLIFGLLVLPVCLGSSCGVQVDPVQVKDPTPPVVVVPNPVGGPFPFYETKESYKIDGDFGIYRCLARVRWTSGGPILEECYGCEYVMTLPPGHVVNPATAGMPEWYDRYEALAAKCALHNDCEEYLKASAVLSRPCYCGQE